MSQENIDRLRAAYEAFNQTGEIVVAHLAPDFELRQASSIIDTAGVFRGPDAFRDVLRELEESFEDFKAEAEKVHRGSDRRDRRLRPCARSWAG